MRSNSQKNTAYGRSRLSLLRAGGGLCLAVRATTSLGVRQRIDSGLTG